MQRRHFTLIELMAAMVVLVIMMGFLFKFIVSAQTLWTASERNSRIYENAQILFELIGRDLSGAVASDRPGEEIGFWVGPTDGGNGDKDFLAFATTSAANNDGLTSIWEVHYKWGEPGCTGDGEYLIRRSVVADTDPDDDWDFYGDAETATPGWVDTDNLADAQEVIDGVEKIEVTCYLAEGEVDSSDKPKKAEPCTVSTAYPEVPAQVKITLTLVDPKAVDKAIAKGLTGSDLHDDLDFCRRQFTKVILLSR